MLSKYLMEIKSYKNVFKKSCQIKKTVKAEKVKKYI